jgi:hypothetical protein
MTSVDHSNLKPEVVRVTTLSYRQSQRALIVVIWILVIVVVVAYIFEIWNGVASIRMLQNAQPSDSFIQNKSTYTQYKNVTIGNIVMSTVSLIVLFVLVGVFYSWKTTGNRLYIILNNKNNPPELYKSPAEGPIRDVSLFSK